MAFFKDNPVLISAALAPSSPIANPGAPGTTKGNLARLYNRAGGLFAAFGELTGVSTEAALAVWYVESSGADFTPSRPILRFENHKFYDHWGDDHPGTFDNHFQFGGRNGVEGRRWENHRFRSDEQDDFKRFHGEQAKEYRVFEFASALATKEAACKAASFGGPQILGSNYSLLGYASAADLFEAFKQSERWHICGFFDFCKSNSLMDELTSKRWFDFAKVYNGAGQAAEYGDRIGKAYDIAKQVLAQAKAEAGATKLEPAKSASSSTAASQGSFEAFVSGLGLKHIKAYELLVKGNQHNNPDSDAFGLNTDPPKELWPNIAETARVLDELRAKLGVPVVLLSVYRSPEYNKAIAGAGGSAHMKFNAIDFVARNHMSPDTWAQVLREMRTGGRFKGGIGVYASFVHLDTRGSNADWNG